MRGERRGRVAIETPRGGLAAIAPDLGPLATQATAERATEVRAGRGDGCGERLAGGDDGEQVSLAGSSRVGGQQL